MREEVINQYKQAIRNCIKLNDSPNINQNPGSVIKGFLNNDLRHNKITKEEYDFLINYGQEKLENKGEIINEIEENETISELDCKNTFEQKRKNFKKKIREEDLDFIPIYKGKFNKVAPKIDKEER